MRCDNYKAAFMGLISDVKGSRKKVTHAEKQVLFKSNIKFATAVDLNKCLKSINLVALLFSICLNSFSSLV